MSNKIGLILEGGAMRSVFSAGVLDFFLEKEIQVDNVLAVSAGAYAGMNYVSGQKGRILDAVILPLAQYKYMGLSTFLKKGTFFDMEYLFKEVPKKLAPFDFKEFKKFSGRFITSAVNCITGENIYYDDFTNEEEFFHICTAANSLPIIAKMVDVKGIPMLDGGMADAIPIAKALEENWEKIIVIFTRDSRYRKKTKKNLYTKLTYLIYRKYPNFLKNLDGRAKRYNDSIEKILELEKDGKAFVFRPTKYTVGNNESNVDKLLAYYEHGYESASERYEELKNFLKK
ncbi:patatin family protein [Lachnospiraceae bacterium OttesenSCG-928-D06]|nr:patatin family protein [Lachnospiraceae bacterium OttesenSCG-928-D06]